MMEEITQQLFEAAQNKNVCRIKLKGEPLPRIIHPYGVCRIGAKMIAIVCWQTMGFSAPGAEPGYRQLHLQDCESVEILEQHFTIDKGFNPANPTYKDWVFHIG